MTQWLSPEELRSRGEDRWVDAELLHCTESSQEMCTAEGEEAKSCLLERLFRRVEERRKPVKETGESDRRANRVTKRAESGPP